MRGEEKLFNALERFDANQRRFASDVTAELLRNIRFQVLRVGAVDKGWMIAALDSREALTSDIGYRYLIDTSKDARVFYDGLVEGYPRATRNVDGSTRRPRLFNKQGIEMTDIREFADDLMDTSFRI
jgi:hypothetical protein